ncbi:MAG: 5'-methylthioinosine phosphorylase [Pseudohongiellaceae bacterium]|jgi:5'-methylthioinosine phosphorylase
MPKKVAIIGGSGLSTLGEDEPRVVSDTRATPYGTTSADIIYNQYAGAESYFLARHGNPHHIAPHRINYRANLWALKQLGVEQVIAVNAVGGINSGMPPASLVLPDQLIDYTHGRESSFYDGVHESLDHIDFSHPFSSGMLKDLAEQAQSQGITIHQGGVYGVTQGPRLETAAEVKRLARDGCDIVGMTAMPEAALARELAIEYVSICLVVNPAAGCSERLITMEEIHHVLDEGLVVVKKLIKTYLAVQK